MAVRGRPLALAPADGQGRPSHSRGPRLDRRGGPGTVVRARRMEADGTMSQDTARGDEWRVPPEVYAQLDDAPPTTRAEIVLGLIEAHPEGRLMLPARD